MRANHRSHQGRIGIVRVVAIAVAVVSTAAVVSWVVFWDRGNAGSTTIGPYSISPDEFAGVGLSFPNCSLIHVSWSVQSGGVANFSVWPPALLRSSACQDVQESNATCPQDGCSPFDPGPVCYETGMSGQCDFTAAQPGYSFSLYPYNSNDSSPTVSFSVTY
jgi:hypothetical protein